MKEKIYSFLSSVLTPSLVMTLISYGIIWGYLSRLGRLDIFYDVFDVKNMVGLIIVSAMVSLMGLLCVFFVVSWLIPVIIPTDNKHLLSYDEIKKNILCALMLSGLFPPLFISFMVGFFKESMSLSLPVSLLILSLIIFSFIYIKFNKIISRELNNKVFLARFENKIRLYLFTPISGAFLAHCQVLPTSLLMKYLKFPEGINDAVQVFIFVLIYFILYFLCLLPGVMFLMHDKKYKLLSRVLLSLLTAMSVIFFISIYLTVIPVMFIHAVVKISGVSDFTAHYFILEKEKNPIGLFKKEIWSTKEVKNSDLYKIHAVDLFSFGNTKLLCSPSILPIYKKSWEFFPGDKTVDDSAGGALKEVAQTCVSLNKKDVKRWDVAVEE